MRRQPGFVFLSKAPSQKSTMPSILSNGSFPFDALDEIFTFACENSRKRCLELGLVCKTWQSRFVGCDRMWSMVLSEGRHRTPKSWNSYQAARLLAAAAQSLRPLPALSLHPIEDCTWEFMCPMVAENFKLVGPGTMFCAQCNKNVYLVKTQEELNQRASTGLCVMMRRSDIDPNAIDDTVIEVAVIYMEPITEQLAKHFMAAVATACDDTSRKDSSSQSTGTQQGGVLSPEISMPLCMQTARTPYTTPILVVRPRSSGMFGEAPRMCRFHLLSHSDALAHPDSACGYARVFKAAVCLVPKRSEQQVFQVVPFFKSLQDCARIAVTVEAPVLHHADGLDVDQATLMMFEHHVAKLFCRIDDVFNPI